MRSIAHRILTDDRWRCGLLCALVFAALWPGLRDHVSVQWGMRYFWLLLLPVIVRVREPGNRSLRYLFVVIPLAALSLWQPHPLFRFFLLFATVYLVIESSIGRLDRLAPLFAMLVAPITHYFFNNFGFGIRLAISDTVASTLRIADPHAAAIGNAIVFRGMESHVDPDCMGLRMITTSLIMTMALVALMERKRSVLLPSLYLPALLTLTLLLVAVSNYARVIALVITRAPAGGTAHELIGLACWLLILLLPMAWTVDRLTGRIPPRDRLFPGAAWPEWKRAVAIAALLPVMVAGFAHPHVAVENEQDPSAEHLVLDGFERSILPNHVVRFAGDGVLIYVKPGKPFYSDDHHPMSCWLGSGFTFTHEVVEQHRDGEICRGLLVNGTAERHTAWWYDNGRVRTTGQLDWRLRAARGEGPFRLVNITADSPQALMREVDKLFGAFSPKS